MIRILLADGQSIVREELASLLETRADLEIIKEAENGQIAVERLLTLKPDVVLMDIRMPVMDGVAATPVLNQQALEIKILVLTTFDNDEYVAQAIRSVNQGYTQLAPGLFEKTFVANSSIKVSISPELNNLTTREKEVLQLIARGYSNKEIAETLYITERTVKNHVNSILRHLNLRDRTQAAIFANKYSNIN